jgi:uracil-DNA glycosylase family 4
LRAKKVNDWNTSFDCPICHNEDCVPASGPRNSPILIVGEFPGQEEIKHGKPLVGRTGTVLRNELAYLGLDMNAMRLCNLWLHEPNGNEECLQYGASQVIKEATGRKAIFLLGSDVVKYFCGLDVSKVTGLKVTSTYLSAPLIMASYNPAIVFKGTVGEARLAIQKFAKEVENLL